MGSIGRRRRHCEKDPLEFVFVDHSVTQDILELFLFDIYCYSGFGYLRTWLVSVM